MNIFSPEGRDLRPTKSSVREAVFNILGQDLNGMSFLDLCSGTGCMGIEALSRGAQRVMCIENDRKSYAFLQKNIASARSRVESKIDSVLENYEFFLQKHIPEQFRFDFIYFDPPFDLFHTRWQRDFARVLKPDGALLIEHAKHYPKEMDTSLGALELWQTRIYGQSRISIFRFASALIEEPAETANENVQD